MKWIGLIGGFLVAWALSEWFGLRGGLLALAALAGLWLALLHGRVRALREELAALRRALLPAGIEPLHVGSLRPPDVPEPFGPPISDPVPMSGADVLAPVERAVESAPEAMAESTAEATAEATAEMAAEEQIEASNPDQPDTIPVPPHAPSVQVQHHHAGAEHGLDSTASPGDRLRAWFRNGNRTLRTAVPVVVVLAILLLLFYAAEHGR